MTLNPKISIIIPTYNRIQLLDECLTSILIQDYTNIEIIVINDNSDEDITGLIKTKYPKITLITNTSNKGPSFAKNQGITASSGNYILFLDSDSELIENNTLSKMISILEKDKTIGSLGGEIMLDKKGKKSKVIGSGNKKHIHTDENTRIKRCSYLPTSNCITRKHIIKKIKGFDPYYFYPMEDADFGLAIKRLGYSNIISFDTGALHKYSKNMRLNRIYTLHKTKTRFLIKNYGILKAISSIPEDINQSMINPAFSFLTTRKEKSEPGSETLGPIEHSLIRKLYSFAMIPSLLLSAYLWNILKIKQTIKSRNMDFLNPINMRNYEKSN